MGYEREQINELCSHLDLVEYVGRDYELKRNGDEYSLHCPCHKDLNPSMYISKTKNSFYCHSCRRKGGPLQWLISIENLTFAQAIEKLKKLTGIDIIATETASSLKFFKSMFGITHKCQKEVVRQILPEAYLNQFQVPPDGEPHEWIAEGITQEMIRKYNVLLDPRSNKIVYPVRDNDGNLIGAKGRTRFKDYKLLGIKKYSNYTRIGTTDFFQGMYENRTSILQKSEIIIFESIKSVMLADGWGYDNCVAAETSLINDYQAKILIKMGIKNVVVAFDNDVDYEAILSVANKIKRYVNVFIICDDKGLLGDKTEKLSPCDRGREIWEELYREKKRIV